MGTSQSALWSSLVFLLYILYCVQIWMRIFDVYVCSRTYM